MGHFFYEFALLRTLAAIGFVYQVVRIRATRGEEAHVSM
jgi:hypothetical protein